MGLTKDFQYVTICMLADYMLLHTKIQIAFKPCYLRVAGLFLRPKICRLIQWKAKGLVDLIRGSFFVVLKRSRQMNLSFYSEAVARYP